MAAKNKIYPIFWSLLPVLFIISIAAAYFFLNFPSASQANSINKVEPIVNGKKIYSYEQMEKDISLLSESYPSIIESKIIGSSVIGKNIYAVKLGKGEKEIIFTGAHHAYEHMTTNVLMKMIDIYATAYIDNGEIADYPVKAVLDTIVSGLFLWSILMGWILYKKVIVGIVTRKLWIRLIIIIMILNPGRQILEELI